MKEEVLCSFVSSLSPCKSPVNLRISPEAEVDLIVLTTQRAERVGCAVAHQCAAQRRLTLMGVNRCSYVHTSSPIDPEVMQAGSARNFTQNFVYDTMAPLYRLYHLATPLSPKSPFLGLRRTSTPVAITPPPTPREHTA